jgi:uncharacterized protein YndB with AHSA1/START domain
MKPISLSVSRIIPASPGRLFEAWTTAAQLQRWWGPLGVRCTHAEVDARPGGRYRIANQLPDGRVVWIAGEFLVVEPPQTLVFTWSLEPAGAPPEQVTVRFEPRGSATEVIVVHEGIATDRARDEHAEGWRGCLAGLAAYAAG